MLELLCLTCCKWEVETAVMLLMGTFALSRWKYGGKRGLWIMQEWSGRADHCIFLDRWRI